MSIDAVAKAAGVSTATVSRVLNNTPGVRAKTIEQVQEAVTMLNYKLPRERSLEMSRRRGTRARTRFRGNIAVIAVGESRSWLGRPITTNVIAGIQEAVNGRDRYMFIEEATDLGKLSQIVSSGGIAGAVLFVSPSAAIQLTKELVDGMEQYAPLVEVLSSAGGFRPLDHVTYDTATIGHLAYHHLRDHGAKSFAFVLDSPECRPLRMRGRAFMDAAHEDDSLVTSYLVSASQSNQRTFLPHLVSSATLDAAVDKLVQTQLRPAGIFVANDMAMVPVQRALIQRGILPGRDVSLVSCDNEELRLGALFPRPASIDLNGIEIGRRAVNRLIARRDALSSPPVTILVQPTLNATAADNGTQTRAGRCAGDCDAE